MNVQVTCRNFTLSLGDERKCGSDKLEGDMLTIHFVFEGLSMDSPIDRLLDEFDYRVGLLTTLADSL